MFCERGRKLAPIQGRTKMLLLFVVLALISYAQLLFTFFKV